MQHASEVQELSGFWSEIKEQWLPVAALPLDASLSAKTSIVTGASSGLGLAVGRTLATMKPEKLILTGRTSSTMAGAFDSIMDYTEARNVVPWQLDLDSNESIVRFVQRVQSHGKLDLLVLSASIAMPDWKEAEGHELHMQSNIHGTFFLFLLLAPLLKASNGRCIVVTSASYAFIPPPPASLTLDELDSHLRTEAAGQSKRGTSTTALSMDNRYMLSKLLQILLVRAIARRLEGRLSICTVNPGMANTSLFRHLGGLISFAIWFLGLFVARRTTEAAKIILYPVFLPQEEPINGLYYSNCRKKEVTPWMASSEADALGDRLLNELVSTLSKVDQRVFNAFK